MKKPDSVPLPDEPLETTDGLLIALVLGLVLVPDPLLCVVVPPVELEPLTTLVTVEVVTVEVVVLPSLLPVPVLEPAALVTLVVVVATTTEEVEAADVSADVVVVPFPGGTWVLPTVVVTLGTELATPVTSGMLVSPAEKSNMLLVVELKFVFVNAISRFAIS